MAQITVRLLGVGLLLSLLSACAPGPSITLLHEGPRPLDAYRGQWLYVNYWAEWCAPCLEEIPELNAFHRADNGAQVLGINFDQVDSALMAQQAEGLDIAFPLALGDPAALLGKKVQPEHRHGPGEVCMLCETHGDVLDPELPEAMFEGPEINNPIIE